MKPMPLACSSLMAWIAFCPPGFAHAADADADADAGWRDLVTVADMVHAYPDRMRDLLQRLDLTRPELAPVKTAHEGGDTVAACEALLAYYRQSDSGAWLRGQLRDPDSLGERVREIADNAVADRFEQQGTVDQVPRGADGHLDWTYEGPMDDLQFAVFLNRHPYFRQLATMWHATGETRYAEAVDALVKDWVIRHGEAPPKPEPHAVWTTLNPGIRMSGPWPRAFYGLQQADAFSPAARLLLLWTVPQHADYLQQHLRPGHNFATMQMNGLGTIGAAFPEFAQAEHWRKFAVEQVLREFDAQVYPDGVQKELTASYHWVALGNFVQLANNLEAGGYPVPEAYDANLQAMYGYLADAMRPNGALPLNNDSDLWSMQHRLLRAAEEYQRPDWRYVATHGAEGERPADPPSRFLPWAGQLISRSGWQADDHWSFFDAGPYGVSHQHNDANHLSVSPFGRDVLVDSGRFAYQGAIAEKFRRPYAFHTRVHNTNLLDGMGQQATVPEAEHPHPWHRITEGFDFAYASFTAGYDPKPTNAVGAWNGLDRLERVAEQPGVHHRALIYVRDRGWIVVDHVAAPGEHEISPLWHFHPDCRVVADGDAVMSTDEGAGNLRITPAGSMQWELNLVKGQETPTLQGWYSRTYGQVQPAVCAVYRGVMSDQATFAWVMNPGRDTPPAVSVQWLDAPQGAARLKVTWPDGVTTHAMVTLGQRGVLELGDGRTLQGRALVQTGDEPAVVVAGRLVADDGSVLAEHLPDPNTVVADLLEHATLQSVKPTGTGQAWRIPLTNVALSRDLHLSLSPAEDNGAGWSVASEPNPLTLAPGQAGVIHLTATAAAGESRYPLPELVLQAQLAEATEAPAVRQHRRLGLPVIGSRPTLEAVQAPSRPALDGRLTDPLWQRQPDVAAFGRMDLGREIAPITQAWLTHDERHLYVAFRCAEPRPDQLRLEASQRDRAVFRDDSVEIMFEPDGDGSGRDYFQLILNAAGVRYDGRGFDKSVDLPDVQTVTYVGDAAWTAEIAIPWTSLGLKAPPEQAAGILLARNRIVTGQHEIFQFPISPRGNHQPHMFARLRCPR